MKILKKEENYLKIELSNGQTLIIDESDCEYEMKTDGKITSHINLYETDQLYLPKLSLKQDDENLTVEQDIEPMRYKGKIMAYSPSDAFNLTAKEWWGEIRKEQEEAIAIKPKNKENPVFDVEVKGEGINLIFDIEIPSKDIIKHIQTLDDEYILVNVNGTGGGYIKKEWTKDLMDRLSIR